MKILFVMDVYYSHNNGTTISCRRYAEVLRSFGHEVRFLAYRPDSQPEEPGVYGLRTYHFPIFQPILDANDFAFAVYDEKIVSEAVQWADVVHFMIAFRLAMNVKKCVLRYGKPMTGAAHVQAENITMHLGLGKVELVNRGIYKWQKKGLYDGIPYVHCPSEFMASELRKNNYTNELRVITNGISDDFVYHRPPKSDRFGDKIVITMVGRLAPEKRQDLIIRAVAYSKYKDKIQLLFAGHGTEEKKYKRLVEKLHVNALFGYYTREELISILHETCVYVHASDYESEAIGCIEAVATGIVPVISDSKHSATGQFALDERSLFHAGDPKDLAKKIDYWIDHPKEREQMEKKYAESANQYRLVPNVRKFEQMLFDAVNRR